MIIRFGIVLAVVVLVILGLFYSCTPRPPAPASQSDVDKANGVLVLRIDLAKAKSVADAVNVLKSAPAGMLLANHVDEGVIDRIEHDSNVDCHTDDTASDRLFLKKP